MARRKLDPFAENIELCADEVQNHDDYLYYKKLSEDSGKPLRIVQRPATPTRQHTEGDAPAGAGP